MGANGDQARAGKSASMVVILLNSTSTVLGKGEKRNDVLHSSGFQIGFLVLKCFEPTAAKFFNSRRGRRTHANRLDAQEVGLALPKPGYFAENLVSIVILAACCVRTFPTYTGAGMCPKNMIIPASQTTIGAPPKGLSVASRRRVHG